MSITRYDVAPWDRYRTDALPRDGGAWVRYDDHVAEVERLKAQGLTITSALEREEERNADLEERVRDLEASVPSLPDIHTVTAAARCWAKHHDAPDHRIDAACARLIETLRPRLTSGAAVSAEKEESDG